MPPILFCIAVWATMWGLFGLATPTTIAEKKDEDQ